MNVLKRLISPFFINGSINKVNSTLQEISSHIQAAGNPNSEVSVSLEHYKHLSLKLQSRIAANFYYSMRQQEIPLHPEKFPLGSKISTQADIDSPWCVYWTNQLKMERIYHRKVWEQAYVPQALFNFDMLQEGKKGIVFGCGREPLPSLFASLDVQVTATDAPPEIGWKGSSMYADNLEYLYFPEIVNKSTFEKNVSLEYVDMNNLSENLYGKYDFCWSICALEHLGSLQAGLDFIKNALLVLKEGGIAVHTTEINFLNDHDTFETGNSVLYQKKHFIDLAESLLSKGHTILPLDFDAGSDIFDRYVDTPPYFSDGYEQGGPHLKLDIAGFTSTCFGLIVQKKVSRGS